MKVKQLAKQCLCVVLSAGMILTSGFIPENTLYAAEESDVTEITVDGDMIDLVNTFRGFGAVSCNNTSRLLLDYKEEHPEQYWQIMNLLFNPEVGAGLNHIKVEMGGDVNSSSGTEPATMRSPYEEANVLRGAGWHFAADAKTINPDITVEILRWGEPKWTQEGLGYEEYENPKYEARYQWYKQTIDAVYEEYGYEIDYVSPGQNERRRDYADNTEFIRYCAKRLIEDAGEENAKYDYSQIQIVAADTHSNSGEIAGRMLADSELMDLIDVVSDHYTLYGNAGLTEVNQKYGKEVWYSEAIAPMINANYRVNVDEERGGVGGKAGMADLATRFIASYSYADAGDNPARMTRFEFQPAVAAFYEGSSYSPKQLLGAFDPWSGYFEADGGLQMVGHFMEFADLGWNYLPDACYADGTYSDGGVNPDTGTNQYLTLKDPETDDYSMIFANNTAQTRKYQVTVKNLDKASSRLNVWETKGPDAGEAYDGNWMQLTDSFIPNKKSYGVYTFSLTVDPYSIMTVTTLVDRGSEYQSGQNDSGVERSVLELPYQDDFEYAEYALDEKGRTYLERRGGTPRYMTDQYGAFEVQEDEFGNHVLTQIINQENRPYDWNVWGNGSDENSQTTGRPRTVFGDHRWTNYVASIDFKLDLESSECFENYAGMGVREVVHSGTNADDIATYTFCVFKDGSYKLTSRSGAEQSGNIENFDPALWHTMWVSADENIITAYVDGKQIDQLVDEDNTSMSGRVTLISGFYQTKYDNLQVLPIEGKAAYAEQKLDDTNEQIIWDGDWTHVLNEGYGHYNRTRTYGGMLEKGVYAFNCGQIRYYKGGNPLQWGANGSNTWGSAADQAHYEFDFFGTGIEIYGEANSSNGIGNVYIDGEKIGEVNYNASTGGTGHDVFDKLNLDPAKQHTLKVEAVSSFISLQKIKVIGEPEEPGEEKETSFTISFNGTGLQIFGNSNSKTATLQVELDQNVIEDAYVTPATGDRQYSYVLQNLSQGEHTIKITVLDGTYYIDGVDLLGTAMGSVGINRSYLEQTIQLAKSLNNETGTYLQKDFDEMLTILAGAENVLANSMDQQEIDDAYRSLRNAMEKLIPADSVVSIDETVETATRQDTLPELPAELSVTFADGTSGKAPVTWKMNTEMFSQLWKTVTITGSVKGKEVKATVEVIPDELVYFIDSGYVKEQGAKEYHAVSQTVALRNDLPDQVTDGTNWGYVNDGMNVKGSLSSYDKMMTGLWAGASKDIVYKLPLEAGTYEFTGAFHDWWSMTRNMKISVSYKNEAGETVSTELGEVKLAGENNEAVLSGIVTIPSDGVVEYQVKKSSGNEAPILSWIAVNKVEKKDEIEIVSLPVIVTEDTLPGEITMSVNGEQKVVPVEWTLTKGDFSITGSRVTLRGNVDGMKMDPVIWTPTVYSPQQVYLIDCGVGVEGNIGKSSEVYEAVKGLIPSLMNNNPDQKMETSLTWGYADIDGTKGYENGHGLHSSGHYGKNTTGNEFIYQLTLDKGEYNITTGHTEWWSGNNRTTQVKASYTGADTEVVETIFGQTGWSTGIQWTEGYVQGHLSIPEDHTEVTLTFTAMVNKGAAVSYISVERGEAPEKPVPVINEIHVDQLPNQLVYELGEPLNETGMVVNGYNGQEQLRELAREEYTVSGPAVETGFQKVIVEYENEEGKTYSDSFKVTVYDPADLLADSIKVVQKPNKMIYESGERFDPSGMEVRLLMKASENDAITRAEILEESEYDVKYDFSKDGSVQVLICYSYLDENGEERELTDSISVIVLHPDDVYYVNGIRIEKTPKKMVYSVNDTFDPDGMELYITKECTAQKSYEELLSDPSSYEVEYDFSKVGKTDVTITYKATDASGEIQHFNTSLSVTVTDEQKEIIEGNMDAVLADAESYFSEDLVNYRTQEEKKEAADQLQKNVIEILESLEEQALTENLVNQIKKAESHIQTAYPHIVVRVIGEDTLIQDVETVGALLSADTKEENQLIEIKIEKAKKPEDLPEVKRYETLDISLLVNKQKEQLKAPMYLTLLIPERLDKDSVIIYHFKDSGEMEIITPQVEGNRMNFAVYSFSAFAVVNPGTPEVEGIKITANPKKLQYEVGEPFSAEGLEVTAYYTDDTEAVITDYEISGFDSSTEGTKQIVIRYQGKSTTFEVKVVNGEQEENPELVKLEITAKPNKLQYKIGEAFSAEGLKVIAYYADGTQKQIMDYEISGFDSSTEGIKQIVIRYQGKMTTFEVEVTNDEQEENPELLKLEVTAKPNKLQYKIGEAFSAEGLEVTAYYADGTQKQIMNYEISGFDSSAAGTKTITIQYQGKTAVFEIEILQTKKKRKSNNNSEDDPGQYIGWRKNDTGWWYSISRSQYRKAEWSLIDGKWYYFNADGYMATGWHQENNLWYYLKEDGSMAANQWIFDQNKWYYLSESGIMSIGWIRYKEQWYYLLENGMMAENQWVFDQNNWYYMNADGSMAVDAVTPDGYAVNRDGIWIIAGKMGKK